jgi:hypothetical protein
MTKTQTKLLEALITAGQQCADCCYSSGQEPDRFIPYPAEHKHHKSFMRKTAKAWDKALQEFRQAQTRQL